MIAKKIAVAAVLLAAATAFSADAAQRPAQKAAAARPAAQKAPAIPEADAYVPIPGGVLPPTPARIYRGVFDARQGARRARDLVPAVLMAADEVNTFAAHGLVRENYKFAIVFHSTAADEAVMTDKRYRARHGINNPNLPVLAKLKQAGVQIYVCGQQLAADKVKRSDVSPLVYVADDALVAIMTLSAQGYTPLVF